VKNGGRVLMAFKSGFTDEHSTVRHVVPPGPLRAAAGFHYQEFTSLPEPRRLTPDAYGVGERNTGSVWQEFLVPDTARAIESFDHRYWNFPAITRNQYGKGMLVYEATVVTDELQRAIVRDLVTGAGLTGPDQQLPPAVKVRHGRNTAGALLHYYLNFSDGEQSLSYPYADGTELLTGSPVRREQSLILKPWDLAIVAESRSSSVPLR
jgi:beta-galactosidase